MRHKSEAHAIHAQSEQHGIAMEHVEGHQHKGGHKKGEEGQGRHARHHAHHHHHSHHSDHEAPHPHPASAHGPPVRGAFARTARLLHPTHGDTAPHDVNAHGDTSHAHREQHEEARLQRLDMTPQGLDALHGVVYVPISPPPTPQPSQAPHEAQPVDPLQVEYAPWTPPTPDHAAHEEREEERGQGAITHGGREEGEGQHVDEWDQQWEDEWEDEWDEGFYGVPEYDPEEWENEEEWWNAYHYEDEEGNWHEWWYPNELTTGDDGDIFYDDHEDHHDGHFHTEF